MTDKLSRERLIEWLEKCWSLYKTSQDEWQESEQAYEQIKALLSPIPEVELAFFMNKWKSQYPLLKNTYHMKQLLKEYDSQREGKEEKG